MVTKNRAIYGIKQKKPDNPGFFLYDVKFFYLLLTNFLVFDLIITGEDDVPL